MVGGNIKMHIVFVTVELATAHNSSGGLASYTANMARIFTSYGHKVTILLASTKEEKLQFDDNIALIKTYIRKDLWNVFDRIAKVCTFYNTKKSTELRKFFLSIYKSTQVRNQIDCLQRQEKIDIIHYCNLDSVAFRAGRQIPYVIRISSFLNMWNGANSYEGNIEYRKNKLSIKDKLSNYTIKRSRYVISPSKLLAEVGQKELGIRPAILESPFVLNNYNWNYDIYNLRLSGKKYIVHFGSLKYLKGTHIVAQIANDFLRMHADFYLVMAGNSEYLLDENGNKVHAHELVKKSAGEFSERVIYVGRLVREQLYPIIQGAQVCLLPSRIDNLPNTCIEAMALGNVVIGTRGASFEQLIVDRVSGYLCERDNSKSYLEALNEALNMDTTSRIQMVSKAKERVRLLSPDVIYKNYLEFYKQVIQEW